VLFCGGDSDNRLGITMAKFNNENANRFESKLTEENKNIVEITAQLSRLIFRRKDFWESLKNFQTFDQFQELALSQQNSDSLSWRFFYAIVTAAGLAQYPDEKTLESFRMNENHADKNLSEFL
jgi:hypothetical protein